MPKNIVPSSTDSEDLDILLWDIRELFAVLQYDCDFDFTEDQQDSIERLRSYLDGKDKSHARL